MLQPPNGMCVCAEAMQHAVGCEARLGPLARQQHMRRRRMQGAAATHVRASKGRRRVWARHTRGAVRISLRMLCSRAAGA